LDDNQEITLIERQSLTLKLLPDMNIGNIFKCSLALCYVKSLPGTDELRET
jgi:hypothetical protein